MAEIYFQCPVCKQRLSVNPEAAAAMLDCPTCRSTLVVPEKSNEVPKVEIRRLMTVSGASTAELYEEIEKTRGLVFKEHERTKAARAEVEQFKAELSRVQAELNRLQSGAAQSKGDTEKGRQEAEQLKEELSRAKADAEQARGDVKRAQVELEKGREEAERMQAELEKARDEAKRSLSDAEQVRAEGEKALANAALIQESQSGLRAELEKMRADLEVAIRDRDAIAIRLEASDSAANGAASAVQKELADLRQENAALTALRDEFRLQAEKAEISCSALQDRVAAAEKERAELKAHVALLQVQFEESVGFRRQSEALQQQVSNLQERLNTVTNDRDALRTTFEKADAEIKALRSQLEAAMADAEKQRGLAVAAESRVQSEAVSSELSEVNKRAAELEKLKGELTAELESLRKERDELKTQLLQPESEPTATAVHADDSRTESRAELERLRRAATLEAEKSFRLKSDLEHTLKKSKELQKRVDELVDTVSAREAELGAVNQRLAAAVAERDQLLKGRNVREEAHNKTAASETGERSAQPGSPTNDEVAQLEREAQRYQQTLQQAQKELEKSWAELEQTRRRLTSAETTNRENTAKLVHAAHAERTYKALAEQAQQALDQERLKLQPLIKARDQLVEELKRAHEAQQKAVKTAESTESKTGGHAVNIARLESRLIQLQTQLGTVTEERDRARSEVEVVNAGLERAKQHVSVLHARRDQMKEEITRLRASLGISPEVEG